MALDPLVSTEWLATAIGRPELIVLDATFLPVDPPRDAQLEYARGHIPSARFLDLGAFADNATALPSMLPSADRFARRVQALGIGEDNPIVVYDSSPWRTAARAWWMLRLFGARDVAILDGGLGRWRSEGRPLETGYPMPGSRRFNAVKDDTRVRSLAQVRANIAERGEQLVDARSAGRFTGDEQDPRGGIAAGHVPGSRSLPYPRLFRRDGTWKRGAALRKEFTNAGIDPAKPLVATCGSGITACAIAFAAHLLGAAETAIYDGSWTEWGGDPATPKATGPA